MAAVKRSRVDEHDGTCQPVRKRPRLSEMSVHTQVNQPTRKSLRLRNRELGQAQSSPPQRVADSLVTQNFYLQQECEGESGPHKVPPRLDETTQNGAAVETSRKSKVRKEISRLSFSAQKNKKTNHPAPVVKSSCQTDKLDKKDIYHCPHCTLPCWLCNTTNLGDKPPPEVVEDNAMADDTTTRTSTITSNQTKKRKRPEGYLGPKDKDFETKILAFVRVHIKEHIQYLKPEDIFPDPGQRDTCIESKIFLEIDRNEATKIASQFAHFHQREYDENTLINIVTKELAPFDRYVSCDDPEVVTSLRRDQWRPGKEGPTIPDEVDHTYDWDITPDMTYMPSINIFSQDLREELVPSGLVNLLADPHGVCPYLTLELKCNEKTGKDSDAKRQIAVASVIWLYQRLQIKLALNNGDNDINPSDLEDLQHYSIVINSINFQVWLTRFDGKKYRVGLIHAGHVNSSEGIEMYQKWWNAIHAWGLGPNAQSFKKDAEALWKKKMNESANPGPTPPRSDGQA